MHIGVFILLLLSGERNFGVRLNKPYSVRVPMDIPVFTGTHADLLIIVSLEFASSVFTCSRESSCYKNSTETLQSFVYVLTFYSTLQVFHKIITSGHQRLQPLFDCLLTIIVNGKLPTLQ